MQVPKSTWQYKDTNIQNGYKDDFTRSDRVILFVRPSVGYGKQQASSFRPVGFIQGMSHQEQKQLQLLYELGSSAPMIIPGLTQGNISLQRVLLNGYNFLNTIYSTEADEKAGNPIPDNKIIRSIRELDRPFDALLAKYRVYGNDFEELKTTESKAVETIVFQGCHIQSRSEQIQAGGQVVMEQVQIMYEKIPDLSIK